MASSRISVAIVSPTTETRTILRNLIEETGLASVLLEVDQYCATYGDRPTRRIIDVQPQVILVDMNDSKAAVRALTILHLEIPDAWLYVSAHDADSQAIIESMRAGAREFLPQPIDLGILTQAFARYITEHRPNQEGGKGVVYCVTASKEGVGATSIAINTAVSLATLPDTRVALIDLNSPVGDAAAYLNLKPQYTVADALAAAMKLDPVLLETFMNHAYGISVLAGLKEFQPLQMPGLDALSQMLQVITQYYTHTFIDLPPNIDLEQLQVLVEISSAMLVILTPELPTLWRTDRYLRFLSSAGNTDKLRLIVNRVTANDDIDEKAIVKALNHEVYWKLPNNYKALINAINSGKPLVTVNNSALVASYMKLAHRLTGMPELNSKSGRISILRRMFPSS
jgi:pilus assembly protein CpaE